MERIYVDDDRVGAVQPREGGQEASAVVVMLSVIGKLVGVWTRRRQDKGGPVGWTISSVVEYVLKNGFGIWNVRNRPAVQKDVDVV